MPAAQHNSSSEPSPIPWLSRTRVRFLAFGVLLATIPVVLVSTYYLYFAKRDLQQSIQIENALLVERIVQEVDTFLFHTEETLQNLSSNIPDKKQPQLNSLLYQLLRDFPMMDEVVILDRDGTIRQGVNRFKPFEIPTTRWLSPDFDFNLKPGEVYYNPINFLMSGIPTLKIIVPYFSDNGEQVLGALGAQIRLRSLLTMIRSPEVKRNTDVFLVDKSGTLIAHNDLTRVLEKTDVHQSLTVRHFLQYTDPAKLPSPNQYVSYSGQEVLGVYDQLARTGWAVVVEQPTAVAFARINTLVVRLIFFLVIILLAAVLVSIFLALSFTRPIEYLERAVREAGRGDLSKRIIADRHDELGHLAKAFNDMLDKLRTQTENLIQEKERLDTIVKGIGAGLALIYPDQKVAWMNPILASWVQNGGNPRPEQEAYSADDLLDVLNRGEKQRVFHQTTYPLEHMRPNEPSSLIVVEDITEQRQMEEMVVQADKLSALGLLASGFAHEINNPLATIQGYAEDLEEQLQAKGSDPANSGLVLRYLGVIRKNIERAKRVTQSLLNFSRKPEWKQERIDVVGVIEESLALMNHAILKKEVQLSADWPPSCPRIKGDTLQLMQVFINVLSNALDALPPGGEIRISVRAEGENLTVRFKDNGEGIAPELLPKVFDPFFTTKEIGKGTGLGLSISYGIIARMGGSIRLESEKGRGTEVIVTLPLDGEGELS